MTTLQTVLARHDITVADLALAEIDVPVLTGPQRQGDVLIIPRARPGKAELATFTRIPLEGDVPAVGEGDVTARVLRFARRAHAPDAPPASLPKRVEAGVIVAVDTDRPAPDPVSTATPADGDVLYGRAVLHRVANRAALDVVERVFGPACRHGHASCEICDRDPS
jgi:hypothetical protein